MIGPPAIFVLLTVFVFLNILSLARRNVHTQLAAIVWRLLNHSWPGAQTVNAERSILYFNGEGVSTDLLT